MTSPSSSSEKQYKLCYRPAEAQKEIGVKNTKFWALVKEGRLETKKIGRATVVPGKSLKEFVENLPNTNAA